MYTKKVLNEQDYRFCTRIMSANAFAAVVLHYLAGNQGMTCVRASDGERALITHAQGGGLTDFLQDKTWLEKYGVAGANLQQLGWDILKAGNDATFLAPTISGLWLGSFTVHDLFKPREQYIDIFYPYRWGNDQSMLKAVLNHAGSVFLAHHDYTRIIGNWHAGGEVKSRLTGFPLTSWREHEAVIAAVERDNPSLVLICGGPHGKVLTDRLGKLTNNRRVVLDVGSAVENNW